jgi:hypothetical protein
VTAFDHEDRPMAFWEELKSDWPAIIGWPLLTIVVLVLLGVLIA